MIDEKIEGDFTALVESTIVNCRKTHPDGLWQFIAEQQAYGASWMLVYAGIIHHGEGVRLCSKAHRMIHDAAEA